MKMFRWFLGKNVCPKGISRSLGVELAKKHGLDGKIAYKFPKSGEMELILLVSDDGQAPVIPGGFLKEFLYHFFRGRKPWQINWDLKIRTMASKEFEEIIDNWNAHCANFWAAYG